MQSLLHNCYLNCVPIGIVLEYKYKERKDLREVLRQTGGTAMLYFWTFLVLCILSVSCYIWQVMGVWASISSFIGMAILSALIYFVTMWLTTGDEMVTGLFLFLAPTCGLIIRFMVGDSKH